ncbi:MAG: CaiB/BaiF CoA transferase family protein [Bacillota bacterium]
MTKPLDGIRVLDVTTFLSGPYATQLLAGLGAEVIKVEQPAGGDPARISPPFGGPAGAGVAPITEQDLSFGFLKRCRNKKSITLNLKSAKGKEIFLSLAKKSDVVMENFRPGTMDRLGLGYSELSKVNPKIIYCSLSGFGLTGAYAHLPAFDIVIQAMSGLMTTNGTEDMPPLKVGLTLADLAGGLYSVIGILAAIQQRHVTGRGQLVECSMLEALLSLQLDEAPDFWAAQGKPLRSGNRLLRLTPFNAYPSRDGWVVIASGNDTHWARIAQAMGQPELAADARFQRQSARTANANEVDELITRWTKTMNNEEIVSLLEKCEVPCAPVRDILKVLQDEELKARGAIVDLEHPATGVIDGYKSWGMPIKFSDAKAAFDQPAPFLGQHNHEVYADLLGLSESELRELVLQGVV